MQLGRGHTKGDTVLWLPQDKVMLSGDLVEYGATPYTGDAYLADWRRAIGTESARLAARRASSQDILLLERGSGNLAAAHDEVEARRSDSRFA